jgi:translocation and assembly module TamB
MLRWIGSLMLVLVLALLALAAWVVGTEAGTAWLAREAEAFGGGALRIVRIRGTLAGGLEADELVITAGTTTISGKELALRILPAGLLGGRLSVANLRAGRIEITLTPTSPPTGEPFRMPRVSTPLPVKLDEFAADVLEIRRGDSVQSITGVRFAGSLRETHLRVRTLQLALAGLTLRAEGSATLEPELPLEARVEWRLADPALTGAGTLRGTLAALELGHVIYTPGAVTVTATVRDAAVAPRVKAEAHWESLQAQVPGLGAVHASAGSATLEGTAAAWNATLISSARAETLLPPAQVHAAAHGDRAHVVFDELLLQGAFGRMSAQGDFEAIAERRLRLDITASDLDTAAFRRGLEGRLSARARLEATLPGEIRLAVSDLRGRLLGRPLSGAGEITFAESGLRFSNVTVRAGPNRLNAHGTVGDRLTGRFDLVAPDLSVLWPGLTGSIDAHASLAGTRSEPVVVLEASGQALAVSGYTVQGLELHGRIDNRRQVQADLAARGIGSGDTRIGDLEANLQGKLTAHRLTARLSGGALEAGLESAGSWDGTTLEHRVENASLSTPELGEWRLAGAPAVSLRSGAATVGDHCWEQTPESLCLSNLAWSPDRTTFTAALQSFDLQHFDQWLPADLGLTGRAYAAASMEITAAGPDGSLIWRQEKTRILYAAADQPLATEVDMAQVAAQFKPGEVLATLEIHGEHELHVSGNGRLSGPIGRTAALDARINGQLPDIGPLVIWLAGDLDLAEAAGRVVLEASVTGTVAAPRATGEIRLAGGAAALPALGVKLDAIEVVLRGDGSDAFKLQGTARAGGPLMLDGEVRPIEKGGPEGWLRVRGRAVDAVRLPDSYVQAAPDVTLRYAGGQLRTEGSLTIPKADIVVRALPETAVSPSPDTVVHDREATATNRGRRVIGGEIAVSLGPDVRLRAFGLDTLLEGTVKVSQGEDGEAKGYGVVRLEEGKFGAYGKELIIERGTLGFAGPLDDPSVDIRATRHVEWEGKSVTAGILMTGTTSRPESRVFSEPAMSEADALSYLISGRPMQSANANDRSAIAGAMLSLGVKQTSPLTEALGSAIALDELGMEGGTLDETELVAGKQIGSDLYVRFTYGLFNRIGTLMARYKLGHGVSIEAGSGEDQTLDLIYSVETD